MTDISVALSPTTRYDSFSDYIRLDAYRANRLETRANVALGGEAPVKSWFIPMPQQIDRMTAHNYEVVEHSVAYSLAKGVANGRKVQVDSALVSSSLATVGAQVGGRGPQGGADSYKLSDAIGGLLYLSGVGSAVTGFLSSIPALQDFQRNFLSEYSDQPSVGLSTQELKYGGSIERSFQLNYQFIAKTPGDVYGPNGILQILAELESWSFPISFDDAVSGRDLIKTPPIFTLKHVRVDSNGGFSIVNDSAPLAALGQPQLLVLRKVGATHETKSVVIDGVNSYPIITNMSLELADMEPLAQLPDVFANYGNISVPKIACRSEIYARAGAGQTGRTVAR